MGFLSDPLLSTLCCSSVPLVFCAALRRAVRSSMYTSYCVVTHTHMRDVAVTPGVHVAVTPGVNLAAQLVSQARRFRLNDSLAEALVGGSTLLGVLLMTLLGFLMSAATPGPLTSLDTAAAVLPQRPLANTTFGLALVCLWPRPPAFMAHPRVVYSPLCGGARGAFKTASASVQHPLSLSFGFSLSPSLHVFPSLLTLLSSS